MRRFYYGVAIAATALACLLWLFVFGVWPGASSVPAPSVLRPVASVGWLPVPPRLRPADPVRAILFQDMQSGRAVCDAAEFYARQAGAQTVRVLVDGRPVPCP